MPETLDLKPYLVINKVNLASIGPAPTETPRGGSKQ